MKSFEIHIVVIYILRRIFNQIACFFIFLKPSLLSSKAQNKGLSFTFFLLQPTIGNCIIYALNTL